MSEPSLSEPSTTVGSLASAPVHSIGAVLRLPAFRRLWIGLGLSSLGDWLGLLALTALAGKLAGNSYESRNFAIAGVLFLRVLPAVVIGPVAGWITDRLDRRWTLVIGDILRGLLFASIPLYPTLPWVFAVTVLVEAISLVWLPAKDASVPNLVPRARLEAANQLSLATTYASALPAAGIFTLLTLSSKALNSLTGVLGHASVALALYFNAASFVVSGILIATLRQIPPGSADASAATMNPVKVVVEGWSFVARTRLIRGLVVGIVGAFAAGGVVIGLARVYVGDLGAGNPGYGVLFGAVFLGLGVGMMRGTRTLSGLTRRRLFGLSLTAAGILLAFTALVQNIVVVCLLTVFMGMCAGVTWITGYTLLGLEVEDRLRGRAFAFVQSLIRLTLALVLAVAPLLAGVIGRHELSLGDGDVITYNGAAITIFIASILATTLGLVSFRQMDDRRGISLWSDLRRSFVGTRGVYSKTGVFVAFEGGEGAGKSTQSGLLTDWLRERGYRVLRTHEPGDTAVGGRLRSILLDPATGRLSHRTEALLYAADKSEHIDTVVAPALARGEVVVTDRYVDSTLAYQGAGRELVTREVERVARWATADLRPHLTVLLDLPPRVGLTRFESPDRLESEPVEFHERVRQAFLALASANPEHYLVVDATQPPDEIAKVVRSRLGPLLDQAVRE